MREHASLILDSGEVLRVQLDRAHLGRDEFVVYRIAEESPASEQEREQPN